MGLREKCLTENEIMDPANSKKASRAGSNNPQGFEGSPSNSGSQSFSSGAPSSGVTGRWPQEQAKIQAEMERRTRKIQAVLERGGTSSIPVGGRAGRAILILIILVAVGYGGYWMWTKTSGPGRGSEKQTYKEFESMNMASAGLAQNNGHPASAQAGTNTGSAGYAAKSQVVQKETLWLPAPVAVNQSVRTPLKIRLILDASYDGPPRYFVNRDSTWLLMRANMDSGNSLRTAQAYIDTSGAVVIK